MCNIWQIKDFPEMSLEAYLKLPKSLRDINISGGEPFLRNDLPDIVKNIKKACPKAKINISSNGFLVETIKNVLPKILTICPDLRISISVDGIGLTHEKVRRVPQAWGKVLETIRFCRANLGIKHVKLAFTLNNENYLELQKAYEWSEKLGCEFTLAVAHSSDFYFGKENKLHFSHEQVIPQFDFIIKKLLRSFSPKKWVRAYFIDGLKKICQGQKRPLEPFAGEDFFYLDPRGDVYPSVLDNVIMGNINDFDSFDELWLSKNAFEARDSLKGYESNYWMVCTARTAIKRNPLKIAKWLFFNK